MNDLNQTLQEVAVEAQRMSKQGLVDLVVSINGGNLAKQQRIEGLEGMVTVNEKFKKELEQMLEQARVRAKHIHAPEDEMLKELCERLGYGAVMDAASRLWMNKSECLGGAHIIAGCYDVIALLVGEPLLRNQTEAKDE